MREYDEIAEWFTATRSPDVGVPDLTAFAETLPPGARVLDLGCGDGVPISQTLLRAGLAVTALDSSPAMVEQFRAHVPGVPVRCARIQDARFARGAFDAVVAWGVLFHLSEADQTTAIRKVAEWLTPTGRFLFTSGGSRGVAESEMDGVPFRYVSLGAVGYRDVLARAGMRMVRHYADAWQNDVYVAEKATSPD
ncbi:class I SAM-dependent methyltransferase [Rubrivirga sp. IMCC45206]|uniref:class I SAM-dependent methyltransferase n=1 Tax=Rubrivirga sp. IMCC45206 TaxID=3391614 RepID=UPI00398FD8AB